MKRLLALLLSLVLMLGVAVPAYATGDGNFDGGGGGMGSGTSTNYWNPGMDGVRISVVNVDSHAVVGNTIDWSNQNPSTNMIHFGKVSKLSYKAGGRCHLSWVAIPASVRRRVYLASFLPAIIPPALRRLEAILQMSRSFGRLPDMWEWTLIRSLPAITKS